MQKGKHLVIARYDPGGDEIVGRFDSKKIAEDYRQWYIWKNNTEKFLIDVFIKSE